MRYEEPTLGVPRARGDLFDWGPEPFRGVAVRPGVAAERHGVGLLPWVSVAAALGLLVVAVAYNGARAEEEWAPIVLWTGVLLMLVPIATRLIGTSATPAERVGLVTLLGVGLYCVKFMYSPSHFDYPDELQHWRTANDIAKSGHLFGDNPILPVSPFFPGLEIATVALGSLGGLSLFWAGTIVVGAARLAFVLMLFLFFREVTRSAHAAGIAAMLYMANPNFVYFNGQFAYESLGLPCAAMVMFALARRDRHRGGASFGFTLVLLLASATVVLSHHMTSYSLTVFLIIWTLVTLALAALRRSTATGPIPRATAPPRASIGGATALLIVMTLTWLLYVATLAIYYLAPHVVVGFQEFLRLIAGEAVGRELFRDATGQQAPLWERLTGYASAALVLLGLPFGLRLLWRDHRANPAAIALAFIAVLYPATLPLRLTPLGVATAGRLPEFLFFGIGLVLALFAVDLLASGRRQRLKVTGLVASATVIFLGGVLVGWGPPRRLPGPYLVAADVRGVDTESVTTSDWARENLGPNNRMATDRINGLLMGSYGEQRMVSGMSDKRDVTGIFFTPAYSTFVEDIVVDAEIRYLLIDLRLSTGLPLTGIYYDTVEPNKFRHTKPMDLAALTKFDAVPGIARVYDSGDIVIYDVAGLYENRRVDAREE